KETASLSFYAFSITSSLYLANRKSVSLPEGMDNVDERDTSNMLSISRNILFPENSLSGMQP
ncbi:hypothetical protein NEM57_26405, partial [Escherichia coli]|nr:hypothetical protein [Escherichia coli]